MERDEIDDLLEKLKGRSPPLSDSLFSDVTLVSPDNASEDQLKALQELEQWLRGRQQEMTLGGYAGTGKALPVDEIVQTPNGPQKIGNLRVGDFVLGADGNPTRVCGVYPQGERQAYRVTFRDKSFVECDAEHLWFVWTQKLRATDRPPVVKTLREMMDAGFKFPSGSHRFCVPLCPPVSYSQKKLPVHPYLLGLLLGDGTSLGRTPTLCTPDIDRILIDRATELLPQGMCVRDSRAPSCPQYRLVDPTIRGNRLTTQLRGLGLALKSPERFIPEEYLLGDIEQRWDLLRGLMDTDGSCVKNRTSFSTMSNRLVVDIVRLVQSLGGTAIPAQQNRGEWHVNVKTFECPFSLPRKAKRWSPSKKNPPSRFIVDAEPTRICDHVCIKIEAEDGLFLTKDFIVTHNTTLIRSIVGSLSDKRVVVAAFTGKAVSVLQDKGIAAQTLHSLLYTVEVAPEEWVTARDEWRATKKRLVAEGKFDTEMAVEDAAKTWTLSDSAASDALENWIYMADVYGENANASPHWVDVDDIEADLVIVDEASMVSNQLYDSLRKHDARLLFVGDHGQLEPIGENPGLMMDPDIRLETIHRQAAGSGIIQFAHYLREGGDPRHWTGTSTDVVINPREHVNYGSFDAVICGFNDRRVHLNHVVRHELGFSGPLPQRGEKLICLQNKRHKGLFNGLICECLDVEETDDEEVIYLTIPNAVGKAVRTRAWLPQFGNPKAAPFMGRSMSMFDWGYCLTCHKSQGSEFDNVCVVEQISSNWTAERWRYTSSTRTAKKLTYLC